MMLRQPDCKVQAPRILAHERRKVVAPLQPYTKLQQPD